MGVGGLLQNNSKIFVAAFGNSSNLFSLVKTNLIDIIRSRVLRDIDATLDFLPLMPSLIVHN